MQSHDDWDSNDGFALMRKLAKEMTSRGENLITAGLAGEHSTEMMRGGLLIRRLPDDPFALRLSIGEAHDKRMGESAYLVFRGDPQACFQLLKRSMAALQAALPNLTEG